jgi:hypothetical protein
MFFALGLVFNGVECVGSCFHVLRGRSHFQWYRGRGVPFSCLARPDSFSAVPRAPGPFFMFYVPRMVFGGTEGVGSHFHVLRACSHFQRYLGRGVPLSCLRALTRFRRYRGRPVPFSCFTCPEWFSAVRRASGPVFMFCAPGLVFGGTEGVGSRLHVLRARTRFRRYRGRRVPF